MAGRKNKHSADYFPHYVAHGSKMHSIEQRYGNDGYAVWFKLMERIAKAENHYIDLSDDVQLMFLSDYCNVTEETLSGIIDLLSRFKWIDAFLWSNYSIIFSEDFMQSLEELYKRRNANPMNSCMLYTHLGIKKAHKKVINVDINEINVDINAQSKVKESKVKEREGKKTLTSPEVLTIKEFHNEASIDQIWLENLAMVHKVKIQVVEQGLKNFCNQLALEGETHKTWRDGKSHFARWFNISKNRKAVATI